MGFLDKILGREEEESDDLFVEEEFEEEFEDIEEVEEVDESPDEWENAYEFSKEALQQMYGFTDMKEFVAKAMVYRINTSERYRDRIAIGRETMEMIDETVGMAEGIRGGGTTDWEEAAQELEGAVKVKEQMDKMIDKEEMMVNDAMAIVRDGIDVLKDRSTSTGPGVDTSVRESGEDI